MWRTSISLENQEHPLRRNGRKNLINFGIIYSKIPYNVNVPVARFPDADKIWKLVTVVEFELYTPPIIEIFPKISALPVPVMAGFIPPDVKFNKLKVPLNPSVEFTL